MEAQSPLVMFRPQPALHPSPEHSPLSVGSWGHHEYIQQRSFIQPYYVPGAAYTGPHLEEPQTCKTPTAL